MKNHLMVAMVAVSLLITSCKSSMKTGDTSENALDWQGTYSGVLPCADCAGIITSVTLNQNKTYVIRSSYRGKGDEVFTSEGSFEWNKEGNRIKLNNVGGEASPHYKVGENRLIQLDREGNEIQGNLSALYILQKNLEGIENKYWKLIETNGQPVVMGEHWRREPHMILHGGDMRVTGHGGCNSFTGSYELMDNNRIKFSPMAATKMFCEGASATETSLFRALEIADSFFLKDDTLQLFRARMAPLAKFEAVYLK